MSGVADRSRQGMDVARQTGRDVVRITVSTADAGALAAEAEYGLDGRPTGINDVPIVVIHGMAPSTITTQTPVHQGESSALV